jgi:hypothetical protein
VAIDNIQWVLEYGCVISLANIINIPDWSGMCLEPLIMGIVHCMFLDIRY